MRYTMGMKRETTIPLPPTTSTQTMNNPLSAILSGVLALSTAAAPSLFRAHLRLALADNQPEPTAEIQYLDPETIVSPVVDTTGEYDYVIPSNTTYTCYTTEYPGYTPGADSMEMKCDIPTGANFSRYIRMDVEWMNSGTNASYTLLPEGNASIISNGNLIDGNWEAVTHNGIEYYHVTTSTNDEVWLPVYSTRNFR